MLLRRVIVLVPRFSSSAGFSTTFNVPPPSDLQSTPDPESIAKVKQAKSSIAVHFDHGLPVVTVPLPSRNEMCQFHLRPISDTVAIFCESLSREDKGIDYVAIHSRDGIKIAGCTPIEHLLQLGSFSIRINDQYFSVEVPQILASDDEERLQSQERIRTLDDVKLKIAALHSILQIDEFKLQREKLLMTKLEAVEAELIPLEKVRQQIELECESRSNLAAWGGFVAMGVQTGVLFRLTYYEYSWDVVEPLSYFATYSTVLATFGYYLMTRESFDYPTACRRVFSKQFYKRAIKYNFNVDQYNELVKLRDQLKHDLERLRDPLFQHLPATRLASLESELAKLHLTNIPKYKPSSSSVL
uniref:Calcium uniporter protein n=1 Tax=Panagrellus redivivus TaxID=6233 RepID=A0A7E4VCP6_PANRE